MEDHPVVDESEVTLRNFLEYLIRRKKLVLTVFALAFVSVAIWYLATPKTYIATSIVMVSPLSLQSAISPSKSLLDVGEIDVRASGKAGTSQWSIFYNTHMTLLKSDTVLQRIIQKLDLKNEQGEPVSTEVLEHKLIIMDEKPAEKNVFQLGASDKDPRRAKAIVNAWAEQYVAYSTELILGEASGMGDFVMSQFEIAKNNLQQAEAKVNEFRKIYKKDLKAAELKLKKERLGKYTAELFELQMENKSREELLVELKKQIASQERFRIVSKAITDDALWDAHTRKDGSAGLGSTSLKSEEANPIYADLENKIVNLEIKINISASRMEHLKKEVVRLGEDVEKLENEILQNDFQLDQMLRDVEVFKKSYTVFLGKIHEAVFIKSVQLGEARVVSSASAAHRAKKKGADKVVLGILLFSLGAILLPFFIEMAYDGSGARKHL